jgi:pimeloyl-ACP methyl ester carboxylesterase
LIALCALLEAPELFDRVVLLDPVGPTGVKFEKPMYDAFTQMSQDREFCATVMNGTIHQNDPTTDLFRRIVDAAFGIDKSIWHGIPDALRDVDITNQLSRIQHPTLILHGEHDPVLPKEVSAKLATQLPNARYKELLGQGHSTNVENPELFVREVSHFLFDRP